ncbi:MAG: hypothetical protein RI897_165 [Verrucomicrobiota bacterium]
MAERAQDGGISVLEGFEFAEVFVVELLQGVGFVESCGIGGGGILVGLGFGESFGLGHGGIDLLFERVAFCFGVIDGFFKFCDGGVDGILEGLSGGFDFFGGGDVVGVFFEVTFCYLVEGDLFIFEDGLGGLDLAIGCQRGDLESDFGVFEGLFSEADLIGLTGDLDLELEVGGVEFVDLVEEFGAFLLAGFRGDIGGGG